MKVELAKSAGFCFGVKRAVQTVYDQIKEGHAPIYTYGPIIHNEEVVKEFEEAGVRVIQSEKEIAEITEGTIIIRSHGISRAVRDKMDAQSATVKSQGRELQIVDATCPFVLRIHKYVMEYSERGDCWKSIPSGSGRYFWLV